VTTLGALLEDAGLTATLPGPARDQDVSTVELDSRCCVPGSVFVCLPGTATTGEAFVGEALSRGAVCVVAASSVSAPVVVHVVPTELRRALSALSSAVVGNPASSLTLSGVTGTNGKTSVTWLLDGILSRVGYASSTVGTLTGQRTTPAPPALHRALRVAVDEAAAAGRPGAVALEVSSHALDQGRVDGLRFDVAVFTNLSREHLDYHGTMAAYFEAKAQLFEPGRAAAAVVCVDDDWGRELASRRAVATVEVASDDAVVEDAGLGHTSFRYRSRVTTTRLTGRVNVTNAVLALAAADVLGVDGADASLALATVPPVPGRLEVLDGGPPSVLVDYAHSPDALERVLRDVRDLSPDGRVFVVFGCGGERDAGKRPQMGAVASRLADEVLVTSDNPRSEEPESIIDAIVAGCDGDARVRRDADREAAIAQAVAEADEGDVVLVAGKGHETVQELGATAVPFEDRAVAAEALTSRERAC
jgi:UDP-N-acetylmuramoyl-L-alanyl-D-glutamate--2,6-diaminopimelate ligase